MVPLTTRTLFEIKGFGRYQVAEFTWLLTETTESALTCIASEKLQAGPAAAPRSNTINLANFSHG